MIKNEFQAEKCNSCKHFGYCLVYWGIECKRQGGKKIPRMKSTSVVEKKRLDKWKSRKQEKLKNPTIEIYEPIRTKVATW